MALVLRSCPGVLVPVEPEATDILPVFQPFRTGSRLRPTAGSCFPSAGFCAPRDAAVTFSARRCQSAAMRSHAVALAAGQPKVASNDTRMTGGGHHQERAT